MNRSSTGLLGSSTFENKNSDSLHNTRQSSWKFLENDHRRYSERFWQTQIAASSTSPSFSTSMLQDRVGERTFRLPNTSSTSLLPVMETKEPRLATREGTSGTLKRKFSSEVNLDLNLSLETSREHKLIKTSLLKDDNDHDIDSSLSLSLFSSSSSKETDAAAARKSTKVEGSLDLTL